MHTTVRKQADLPSDSPDYNAVFELYIYIYAVAGSQPLNYAHVNSNIRQPGKHHEANQHVFVSVHSIVVNNQENHVSVYE